MAAAPSRLVLGARNQRRRSDLSSVIGSKLPGDSTVPAGGEHLGAMLWNHGRQIDWIGTRSRVRD